MQNQPENKENRFKPFTILFPIGALLLLGVVNSTKERKNDGSFLDTIGPWIGYLCLILAAVTAVVAIVRFTSKKG
ncbi:hypothetical protein [Flavobacterium rhizosphaerae]|uniref:DUF3955 domain-containing protein n=1 Tax=Flavobacterium rhizosphaerae TaxID=3163298 RepID=A0ABW8YVS7_9FLAO